MRTSNATSVLLLAFTRFECIKVLGTLGLALNDFFLDNLKGLWPSPNCTGEEMALHKIIEHASEDQFEEDKIYESLPVNEEDDDFDMVSEILFEDHDVLMLYEYGPVEKFALGQVTAPPLHFLAPIVIFSRSIQRIAHPAFQPHFLPPPPPDRLLSRMPSSSCAP